MSDQEAAESTTTVEVREDQPQPELALPEGVSLEKLVEPDWLARDEEGNLTCPFPINLFGNRIAVRRDDMEEVSEGGIYIPEGARRKQFNTMVGTVIAVGPGIEKADGTHGPMPISLGDRVVFEKFRAAVDLKVNGFTYHIYNWTDMIGVMGKNAGVKVK